MHSTIPVYYEKMYMKDDDSGIGATTFMLVWKAMSNKHSQQKVLSLTMLPFFGLGSIHQSHPAFQGCLHIIFVAGSESSRTVSYEGIIELSVILDRPLAMKSRRW